MRSTHPSSPAVPALLVVDMQQEFLSPGVGNFTNKSQPIDQLLSAAERCILSAQSAKWPVFLIQAVYTGSADQPAQPSPPPPAVATPNPSPSVSYAAALSASKPKGQPKPSETKEDPKARPTTHLGSTPCCAPGSVGAQLHPAIAKFQSNSSTSVITKTCYSSFADTDLASRLKALNVTQLVVIGVHTNKCVLDTATEAVRLGFPVAVSAPACAAVSLQQHQHALMRLAAHGVRVIETTDIVAAVTNQAWDIRNAVVTVTLNPESFSDSELAELGRQLSSVPSAVLRLTLSISPNARMLKSTAKSHFLFTPELTSSRNHVSRFLSLVAHHSVVLCATPRNKADMDQLAALAALVQSHARLVHVIDCGAENWAVPHPLFAQVRSHPHPTAKLYWINGSLSSMRVLMALHEKNVPFVHQRLRIMGDKRETRTPSFLELNPRGKCPTFVDRDGTVVIESLTILQYLEAMYGPAVGQHPALVPSPATDKALYSRVLMRLQESENLSNCIDPLEVGFEVQQEHKTVSEEGKAQLAEALAHLDKELRFWDDYAHQHAFIAGDSFTLADCAVFPVLMYLLHRGLVLEGRPEFQRLHAYVTRVQARVSARMSLPVGWGLNPDASRPPVDLVAIACELVGESNCPPSIFKKAPLPPASNKANKSKQPKPTSQPTNSATEIDESKIAADAPDQLPTGPISTEISGPPPPKRTASTDGSAQLPLEAKHPAAACPTPAAAAPPQPKAPPFSYAQALQARSAAAATSAPLPAGPVTIAAASPNSPAPKPAPAAAVASKSASKPRPQLDFSCLGAGDSLLLQNVLPPELERDAFERVREEVEWQEMFHRGNAVPRLVALQGTVGADGSYPLYRHPVDEQPPVRPWTPLTQQLKECVERAVGQPLNHALIQYYRTGEDNIGEHSDKTLDIERNTVIVNLSLYAETNRGYTRAMTLRPKRAESKEQAHTHGATEQKRRNNDADDDASCQVVNLPHNSLFVLGWNTNRTWLHAVRKDAEAMHRYQAEASRHAKKRGPPPTTCERVSFTFRLIATFARPDGRIWGQGSYFKTLQALEEDARRHPNRSQDTEQRRLFLHKELRRMIHAFSRENRELDFDWDYHYGKGFECIHGFLDE